MDRARAQGYERLVERLRSGPPPCPWRLPGLRALLNTNEWFVHHEDVRRANGREPRATGPTSTPRCGRPCGGWHR